ncbi:hypothetical protein TNCV_1573711 [Trichonephila clavipes]|nr:hypothetical protein TNCV_1573711 [Trichonephila clavipes]
MSLSSFRVHQDATGPQSSGSTKKGYEHPPSRVLGRMSLSSFRVQQDTNGQQSSASMEKGDEHPPPRGRAAAVGCRCHRSACNKMQPDTRVLPRRKKRDEHPPLSGCSRMSLSSFRVLQDATGQQSSASTEKGNEHPPPPVRACIMTRPDSRVVSRRKKDTKTHRRASAVGCRCHSSAGNNTRTDSRVVLRRKKGDKHLPPRVRGRMSLSSFRVQQDATGQQSSAWSETI